MLAKVLERVSAPLKKAGITDFPEQGGKGAICQEEAAALLRTKRAHLGAKLTQNARHTLGHTCICYIRHGWHTAY